MLFWAWFRLSLLAWARFYTIIEHNVLGRCFARLGKLELAASINQLQYILPTSQSFSPCDAVGSSSGFPVHNTLAKIEVV